MARCEEPTDRRGLLAAGLAGFLLCGSTGCGAPVPDLSPPIVLIVVDAMRADHLGIYSYGRPTSPHIDEWAERGMVFDRAYATSSWTLPSFGSILTGHLPSGHGAGFEIPTARFGVRTQEVAARHFVTLDGGVPTVAEILLEHGFDTGAFVANPFLNPRFGLRRGFQDYDHFEASNSELRRADEVVDVSLDWIDARGERPFFLMVHLFDPHMDYDAPPPFRGRFATVGGSRAHPVQGMWSIRNQLAQLPETERQFIVDAGDRLRRRAGRPLPRRSRGSWRA